MGRVLPLALLALVAACSKAPPPPRAVETEVPEELRARPAAAPALAPSGAAIGTPMKDRVATLGLLNKRNNIARDLTMKPGETQRFGDVIVALKACERTAPWEMPHQTGAFVQVWVREGREGTGFGKVFSGWLFRESPSLNVVEHPIYDVWVKDCTMRFPGEEATAAPAASGSGGSPRRAAPSPTPTASPSATPEAEPAPPANDATT